MVLLIGNRFGFLVPLFVVLSEAGIHAIADNCFGSGYTEKQLWVWGVGLFPAALICWLFGRWLLGPKPPPDENLESGGEPAVGSAKYARYAMQEIAKEAAFNSPPNSFFFLAMYYWGPLLAVIGVIILVAGWFNLVNLDF